MDDLALLAPAIFGFAYSAMLLSMVYFERRRRARRKQVSRD